MNGLSQLHSGTNLKHGLRSLSLLSLPWSSLFASLFTLDAKMIKIKNMQNRKMRKMKSRNKFRKNFTVKMVMMMSNKTRYEIKSHKKKFKTRNAIKSHKKKFKAKLMKVNNSSKEKREKIDIIHH